jgi:hypothetical protein
MMGDIDLDVKATVYSDEELRKKIKSDEKPNPHDWWVSLKHEEHHESLILCSSKEAADNIADLLNSGLDKEQYKNRILELSEKIDELKKQLEERK